MSGAAEAAPDMRRQILDVAARLLREHSYQSTTVRLIAEQVGIKGGSIYHHFPSKDAIVATVVNEGVRMVGVAVEAARAALPAEASPRQTVQAMIRAHLLASLHHSDYVRASIRTFPHLPPSVRDACREERRRYEAIWAEVIAAARFAGSLPADASPDAVRLLLLGAVNWAGEWHRPGRLSIDDIAHDWAHLVLGP